ncbi:hypothetical protein ACFY0N_27875 [Streptomyces vinaceus]|uniref:hypothetical protein n=1 Tax=Streptomyces vinaceus TaxID=1960 RepID=UPI0035E04424
MAPHPRRLGRLWVAGFLGIALAAQANQHLGNAGAAKALRTEPGQAGQVRPADDSLST